MKIQNTDWGYVEWRRIHDENDKNQIMDIRISVILPGKHQFKHTHYSEEQLLYLIQGEGLYFINDKKKHLKAGEYIYIPAGATHETINEGYMPIKELLISNQVSNFNNVFIQNYDNLDDDPIPLVIDTIKKEFVDPLNIPITIYDDSWNILLQSKCFNSFCLSNCSVNNALEYCDCLVTKTFDNSKEQKFICKHGLMVYHIPIIYKGRAIGYIRGGHILISCRNKNINHSALYDTPIGTAESIKKLLNKIGENIVNLCEFKYLKRDLLKKENDLLKKSIIGEELKNDLLKEKEKVTNLKINHHFLFNTLNSMASMALEENSFNLYNAIIDLSKMFRYTMKSNMAITKLEDEISYVGKYLNLQKLRYGNSLKIIYDIEKGLDDLEIPFNFLQPIVENAFVHGFKNIYGEKLIKISAKLDENMLYIDITNNGTILSEQEISRVIQQIHSNSGHGLSLIYRKLQFFSDNKFIMNLTSNKKDGTRFTIKIPVKLHSSFYLDESF